MGKGVKSGDAYIPVMSRGTPLHELAADMGEKDHAAYAANVRVYEDRRDALVQEHGGRWIAIIDGDVVAAETHEAVMDDPAAFIDALRNEHGEDVVDDEAFLKYVPEPY